jgi:hypothetical protein
VTMQFFVGWDGAMIAAAVQRDVNRIPKWSHDGSLPWQELN